MSTESFELKFVDGKVLNQSWLFKLIERGRILVEKMRDKRGKDITEEDWNLINLFYRIYYNGEYPIMAQKLKAEEQNVTEVGLFACQDGTSSSYIIDGTVVESSTPNQNDKKDGI